MGTSTTLRVGDAAPEFTLRAANVFDRKNEPATFSLRQLVADGPVIVEFLRGTW
jgi:hypothetical protein